MNKPVDQSEWIAQERALSGAGDRRDALLARALRTMPVSRPPDGFAAEVARLAQAHAPAREDARLERMLQQWLFAAMAVGGLVAMLVYGDAIWRVSAGVLGSNALQWILMGGACLALSWLPTGLRWLPQLSAAPPMR
jgi:hypothetical protein